MRRTPEKSCRSSLGGASRPIFISIANSFSLADDSASLRSSSCSFHRIWSIALNVFSYFITPYAKNSPVVPAG